MYEKHDEAKIAKWTALVESAESCALKTNADLAVSAVTTEAARYWADRAGEYAVSARNLLSLCASALAAVRRREAGAWQRLDMLEGRLADAEEKARLCAVAFGENRNAPHAPTREPVTVGGWYECTDGTWARFAWVSGKLVERDRAAEPKRDVLTDSDGFTVA